MDMGPTILSRGINVASLIHSRLTLMAAAALTIGSSSTSFAQVIVPGYPYPAYRYAAPDASVKFDAKPKEAAVYLHGYFAGIIHDYNSVFHLLPPPPRCP